MREAQHHREITTVAQLIDCLRAGPFTSVGSYPVYFYTADGDIVSFKGARSEFRIETGKIQRKQRDRIAYCDVYWEGPVLHCVINNEECPSAYGDPDELK